MTGYSIVVPTIGRPSLRPLLDTLTDAPEIIVVDDRRDPADPLDVPSTVRVLQTAGTGPAGARNAGWKAASHPWVVFLDDDVLPGDDWARSLVEDLESCDAAVAAVQGRVRVPLPGHRRPTDRERNVAGLAQARWITADMAYRRAVLDALGGFDTRFRRAYREDIDLGLRTVAAGWTIRSGDRQVVHPVAPAPWWVSIRDQRGTRDDVMMRRLHGKDWRERCEAGPGMAARHFATTALLAAAVATARRKNLFSAVTAAAWLGATGSFAWRRIRPGPRSPREVAAMAITSIAIPPVATFWRVWGWAFDKKTARLPSPAERVEAVLFDRDGTLVADVPYNGDPSLVRPVPGAEAAVTRLRRAGLRIGMVTNQSGVGRGLLTRRQVESVNRRVEEVVGPLDTILYCPHAPEEDCRCRKPAPGLVVEAARRLGVHPRRCVVVGDILSDVVAAQAAGARPILVPNGHTEPREVVAAPHVAEDLAGAVAIILRWSGG